jgi:hypothetical protein
MVSFSRVVSAAALALLALSAAQAQVPAPRCQDLDATPYQNETSSRLPLLDLLERAAAQAGWSVRPDGFGAWRGPMLRGSVPFHSTKEAVSRFIRDTADVGWRVSGIIDAPNCVIRVSYRGAIPMAASLPSPALRSPSAESASASSSGGPALEVKPGSYLRETLLEWSARAGWSLYWGLGDDVDFRLEVGATYPSDFKAAVYKLFSSLPESIRIRAELRVDNSPPLLYVTRDEGGR